MSEETVTQKGFTPSPEEKAHNRWAGARAYARRIVKSRSVAVLRMSGPAMIGSTYESFCRIRQLAERQRAQ